MKIFLDYIVLTIYSTNCAAQALDLLWPLGHDNNPMSNLNFTNGNMSVDTDSHIMVFTATNSSISDSSGHLLMYSNGCFVANMLDDTMFNGEGLNPDSCTNDNCPGGVSITQGNLILPIPGSNMFYLFHETCNYLNNLRPVTLYYSIIDLSQDSGRGAILSKNTILYSNNLCDGL